MKIVAIESVKNEVILYRERFIRQPISLMPIKCKINKIVHRGENTKAKSNIETKHICIGCHGWNMDEEKFTAQEMARVRTIYCTNGIHEKKNKQNQQ